MANKPFSKSSKDWSKALKLRVKDSLDETDYSKTLGSYSFKDRDIEIGVEGLRTEEGIDTLSHEISHWKLGHEGDFGERTPEYLKSRFSSVAKDVFEDEEGQISLSNLTYFLNEFEVRLYQQGQKYYQIEDENFIIYLKYTLIEQTDLGFRQSIIRTANQAITNMQRERYITPKEAKRFRQRVSSVARSFGLKSRL